MSVIHEQVAELAGTNVQIVYADPPWTFNGNSKKKPGRNARRHYECMSLDEICSIPVKAALAPEANLFLWITGPLMVAGAHLPVMKAWGFQPSGMGFVWIKTKNSVPWHHKISEADLAWGNGLTTIKNAEFCLIGKRRRSLRVKPVHEIIISPRMEHSRKPIRVAERIKEYVGPGRRMVELFSRSGCPGFIPLGNEVGMFDEVAA